MCWGHLQFLVNLPCTATRGNALNVQACSKPGMFLIGHSIVLLCAVDVHRPFHKQLDAPGWFVQKK